ncbi:MAG: carboxypeptidase-like regulatory domain-containing protein [Minisyncoccia bacterium]
MRSLRSAEKWRGMSMIDVLVGTGLVLIIFLSLFGILRASLQISGIAKLKVVATALVSSHIEYLRSLPYDDVGTEGGIPAGVVPQYASSTNAGVSFDVRTYIEYADDAADGLGVVDTNGITTDYKQIKVVVSYTVGGIVRYVTLISTVAPKGIESTTGGGTLLISVVDAGGTAVAGATVHIENEAVSPAVDFSTFTDSSGQVLLPGAPTSTEYQINVSKTGYSSAETYERDATNANPTPGYFTVVAGSTTSGTFAIDRLATLLIRTFSPIDTFIWSDPLDTADDLYSITNVLVSGGALVLSGGPDTYAASGSALSTTTAPARLAAWTEATASAVEPLGTSLRYKVTDASGTPLPDAEVPGNSAGFTGTTDLSAVSTTTYPSLRLIAELSSGDPLLTPQLLLWSVEYEAGPNPLPNVAFDMRGAKTVGSTSGGAPLYKTEFASTTDSSGERTLLLEWDSYEFTVPAYTIATSTPVPPYDVLPNTVIDAFLILSP